MKERARLLGGSTQIESAPGKGTRVQVMLPLGQAVVEAIWSDVERWCGGEPAQDDRTVMVVSYPPDRVSGEKTAAFPRPKF